VNADTTKKNAKTTEEPGEVYHLRLFMSGDSASSTRARDNLVRLCETRLHRRCKIEIVDVLRCPQAALERNVLATPTLDLLEPPPPVRIVGDLSDHQKVFAALRLQPREE